MQVLYSRLSVVWKYNNLLKELVIRDIKVRYRRSVLGLLWTLLYPLLTMIITTIVFSSLFNTLPHYAVYFLSGSILFSFHTEATTSAAMSIVGNAGLLKKVYIPKYLFPLSRVLSSLVNLGFAFLALLLVMLATGAPFHPTLLMSFIPIFYLIIFTTGLSLSLSALTVYFRDVNSLYGVLALLWTYMTPIFYPISIIQDKYSWIYEWNPMYYYIDYLRSLILEGVMPGMVPNLICMLCGIASLSIGYFIFSRTHNRFVLYM
jgi:ABC-type polysaccharide/polyol phosphate export permease